jgi:hypothetical protein
VISHHSSLSHVASLQETGTDASAKDGFGQIPVYRPARIGCADVIKVLYKAGANASAKLKWSNTNALYYMAWMDVM